MKIIKHSGCDGSHCGLADWYGDLEEGIQDALNRGPGYQWTTEWYSSKKEIASARITNRAPVEGNPHQQFRDYPDNWVGPPVELYRVFGNAAGITIEVSVSDDFDTPGYSFGVIPHTTDLDKIRKKIYEVWDEALEDMKDNAVYVGYSVIGWSEHFKCNMWIETYLKPQGDGFMYDGPPGDNYFEWGWQGETELDEETKQALAEWAEANEEGEFTFGEYTIKPWEHE